MLSLLYMSTAAPSFDQECLQDLLRVARHRNLEHGITGMLLYKDDSFMQAIEGEDEVVRRLYNNIQRDPRHFAINTMVERQIEEREFPDWTMACCNPEFLDSEDLAAFNDYLLKRDANEDQAKTRSMAAIFLKKFKHAVR